MAAIHQVEIAIEVDGLDGAVWRVQMDYNSDDNPGYHADWVTGYGDTLEKASADMHDRFRRRLAREGR